MTSQYVKVALNGDGGDESFAGYLRYLGHKLVRYYQKIPARLRNAVLTPLLNTIAKEQNYIPSRVHPILRRLKFLHDQSFEPPESLYARSMIIFPNDQKLDLYTGDIQNRLKTMNSLDYMLEYFYSDHTNHLTDAMLYADVMTYLPGDLLVKMDRMTMAHGLEGRSPFLDHKLMEFAATLPADLKLRGTQLKFMLKHIGKAWLPRNILFRTKQGFSVPIGRWFQHELREMLHDTLSSSRFVREGILNGAAIHRILEEHQTGAVNHQYRLWVLLNLELWYRMFIRHE
jgi:asparagine synthase (glutamine-hydrolysing)